MPRMTPDDGEKPEACSFCGKLADEVGPLISGSAALICAECVDLCAAILAEQRAERASLAGTEPGGDEEGPVSSVRPSVAPPRE